MVNNQLTKSNTVSTIKNVPALRFSEFSGEWDNLKLGSVAEFSKGKGISKANIEMDGRLECIRYGQLYTDYSETIKKVKSRTNILVSELVLSEENDIIIPSSGETQIDIATASCILKSGVALGGDLNIIKTELDGVFLAYYLNSKKKFDIARLSQGVSVVHLYAAQLKLLLINIPETEEQQKIAKFLSAVDSKIEKLAKKKALLEQYKKGMMQKLFLSADTGQVPELRFKDEQGNDYPAWEEKRLEDFCLLLSGCPVKGEDIIEENIGIPLLRGINITEGKIRHSEDYDRFHGGNIDSGDIFLLKLGDVVIGMDGSKVGKNVAIVTKDDVGSFLIQRVARLRGDGENILRYVYSHVTSKRFIRYVDKVNTSSGIPHISLKQIKEFSMPMPCPKEQQKIANTLSSLDNKIDQINTQLEKTKTFKKGLLQQMFV